MMMAMVALVGCTTADDIVKPVETLEVGVAQEPDYTVYSGNTNNTLITTLTQTNGAVSTRSANLSRFGKKGMTLDGDSRVLTAEPPIPADAIDLWQAFDDFCVENNISEGNRQWAQFPAVTGGVYYVPSGKTVDCQIDMNNCDNFTVYVAKDATWKFYGGNGNAYKYIYVLPGGTLEWGYNSWQDGQLTLGNGSGAQIHIWGTLKGYNGGETITSLNVKASSSLFLYKGDMESFTVTGNTFFENGDKNYIYSEIPFTTNTMNSNGGNVHFKDEFTCTGELYSNASTKLVFDKCSTVGKLSFSGESYMDINESFTVEGDMSPDGSVITLNEALLYVKGKLYLPNNCDIHGNSTSTYTSIVKAKEADISNFQNSNSADFNAFKGYIDFLCDEDYLLANGSQIKDWYFWDGGENANIYALTIAKTAIGARNVRLNPTDYYLPETGCRSEIGTSGTPSGDPGNDPTDPIVTPPADPTDPTPAATTQIGHIEINLHQNIHTDWNESKLSIHIRDTSDVEVFIPMPAEYICEADDMYIVQKHWEDGSYVYNSSPETVSMVVAGQTVTLTIEYVLKGDNPGIKVTTSGVNAEVLKACRTAFDDGLTFEVYNYYNYNILDEDGQITGTVTRDKIKSYLNQATVTFLNSGYPRAYINAFNVLDGQTEANPLDCKVTPTDDTNYPKSEDTGFHKNVIYWRGGTAPTE